MADKEQKKLDRERREAERRAADRLATRNKKLVDSQPPRSPQEPIPQPRLQQNIQPTGAPMARPVAEPVAVEQEYNYLVLSRGASSVLVSVCAVAGSVAAGVAIVAATPLVGGSWSLLGLTPLVITAGAGLLAAGSWPRAGLFGKVASSAAALMIFTAFILGGVTQISVEGKPVRVGSTTDRASRLAAELLSDLLTLEDNQALMNLAPEQGRGAIDLYDQAALQSAAIAKKWNPIFKKNLPLPGFTEVLTLTNRAADLQAGALIAYRDQLKEPDASRAQAIDDVRAEITDLLAGPNGAAVRLAQTVAPVGIKLGAK